MTASLEYTDYCDYDSLVFWSMLYTGVYDRINAYCGDISDEFTSPSSTVLVEFNSDAFTNTGRFAVSWTFVEGGGGGGSGGGELQSSIHLYLF